MKLIFVLVFGTLSLSSYAQATFRIKRIEGSGNMGRSIDFAPGVRDSLFQMPFNRIYHPIYDFNEGPVRVEIIEPNLVPNAEIFIALDGVDYSSGWKMYALGQTDTVYSNTSIGIGAEQLIPEWGLLVQVKQVENWTGSCDFVLDCSIEQSGQPWLRFLSDTDSLGHYSNWIRSGLLADQNYPGGSDYSGDSNECFENVLNGTWAPWKLVSHADSIASPSWDKFKALNNIENTHSIDVVITPDQSKWTRCPVLEIADSYLPSIGNAKRFNLRMSPSVDIDGNPDGSGTFGMSWFPGFAVNLETGERLNMAFGENSWLQQDNGSDMIWNPTSTVETAFGDPILGGGHYIYVFGHNGTNSLDDVPLYDEGAFIYSKLSENNYDPGDPAKRRVYKDAMWVAIPLLEPGQSLLSSEVIVKLRVQKPYVDYLCLDDMQNQTHPLYTFNGGLTGTGTTAETSKRLRITAYPNPATNEINVEVGLPSNGTYDLILRSIDGREVMRRSNISAVRTSLNIGGLNSGVYDLSMESKLGAKHLPVEVLH